MSRRYGRNQKRRAREQIAQLSEAVAMANGLAEHISRKNRVLDDQLERAKRLLPDGTVLFEPGRLEHGGRPGDRVRAHVEQPMSVIPDLSGSVICDYSAAGTVDLDVLLTHAVLDQLADKLHFHVDFADGTWAYSISRQGLRMFSRRDLIARISQELAMQISKHCAEKGLLR